MTIFAQELDLGPVTGPRVAVKDTMDVAGVPTKAGSRSLENAPPASRNAAVVEHVLAAGCRIVGKTVLHELAFGITGINDWGGTPVNPRFPALVPGGSSSGSAAAVAAGLADFALGTDTGGSIRIPAACCGVWGLKPSFGRVSREGVMPARTTLDCVGPFADSAEGILRAMEIIDPTFARQSVTGARLGVVAVEAAPHVLAAMRKALAASNLPQQTVVLAGMDDAFAAGLTVINAETWAATSALVATGLVGNDVALRLTTASQTSEAAIEAAEAARVRFTAEVDRLLDEVDVLITPTIAEAPPTLEAGRENRSAVALTRFVRPFNLSGHPALSLPIALGTEGPVSMQIIGRHGADALVCAIGAEIAAAIGERQPMDMLP